MSKHRYYYYDHEACDFVELPVDRRRQALRFLSLSFVCVVAATVLMVGLDRLLKTPEELSLQAENKALQDHLADVSTRMAGVQEQLGELAESDQNLYRALLQATPISEDIRRVGIGGSDPYAKFDRFSPTTAKLLRNSASTLDLLERRVRLQNNSYRELLAEARSHQERMKQLPAILPTDGPVVSGFGKRMHPILRVVRPHSGIDILVNQGTPVVAPGNGVVESAGRGGSLGNYVRIKHAAAGYVTTYAHLSRVGEGIKRGTKVTRGELIGYSGSTGQSTGPHLHYEVRDLDGTAVNPVQFFAPTMTPHAYRELVEASSLSTTSLD